jgi:predicted RND superfamily exporter protein
MWQWIANIILRNRFIILGAITLITVFLGYHAFTSLNLDNKYGLALPKDSPTTENYKKFKEMFGEDGGTLIIALESDSLYTPRNLKLWRDMGSEILAKSLGVNSVISEATLVTLKNDKVKRQFEYPPTPIVTEDKLKTREGVKKIRDEIRNNPFFKDILYNNKENVSLILIGLEEEYLTDKDSCKLVLDIEQIAKRYESKLGKMHFSGLPYIRVVIAKRIQGEMYLFIGFSILVTSILLYIFFRSFRVVGICLTVVGIAVIWAMGSIGFIGWKLSFLMALIPPLMIVIGIPNCIFLMTKFHQEVKEHGNKTKALSQVIQKIGTATFLTNFTTAIGFLTFAFTNSEKLIEFGLAASMNIMMVFILSLCILPILSSFFKPPKTRHLKHLDRKFATGMINFILFITQKKRTVIYLVTIAIVAISVYGMSKIIATGNLTGDLPKSDNILQDVKFLESNFGGSIPFEIMIHYPNKSWWKRETLDKIDNVQSALSRDTMFSKSVSAVDIIKWINMCYYDNDSTEYKLYNSRNKLVQRDLLRYIKDFSKRSDNGKYSIKELIDTNNRVIRIRCQIQDIGSYEVSDKVNQVKDTIERILNPDRQQLENYYSQIGNNANYIDSFYAYYPGVYNNFRDLYFGEKDELKLKFEEDPEFARQVVRKPDFQEKLRAAINQEYFTFDITGTSVVASEGTKYLVNNLISSIIFAVASIAVLMAILFRSWRMVVISMIPNLVPLFITGGVMGFLGIPLKPSTLLVFSIAFGISVDDTIHYLAKYRQELKQQKWDPKECVLMAIRESGLGMFYTSIVLFFGFSVFTFSQFGGTQALGYLISLTLISAMVCNLVILPSLLLTLNKWITTKSFKEPYFDAYDEESDIDWNELQLSTDREEESEKNN